MKTENAIKKLVKAGYPVAQSRFTRRNCITGEMMSPNEYYTCRDGDDEYISFYDQGGEVICLGIERHSDRPDSMTDYFPKFYTDSMAQALRVISR